MAEHLTRVLTAARSLSELGQRHRRQPVGLGARALRVVGQPRGRNDPGLERLPAWRHLRSHRRATQRQRQPPPPRLPPALEGQGMALQPSCGALRAAHVLAQPAEEAGRPRTPTLVAPRQASILDCASVRHCHLTRRSTSAPSQIATGASLRCKTARRPSSPVGSIAITSHTSREPRTVTSSPSSSTQDRSSRRSPTRIRSGRTKVDHSSARGAWTFRGTR